MKVLLAIFLGSFALLCGATPFRAKMESVPDPEYMDKLLHEERYEEYIKLTGIPSVDFLIPKARESNVTFPFFHKDLPHGDILLPDPEARQQVDFSTHGFSKWDPKEVPYLISRKFTSKSKGVIQDSINEWNNIVDCIKWRPARWFDQHYVHMFPGDGCYSKLGRTGGVQPLSLQENGCIYKSTVLHEMKHAIGFHHEHTRTDRDDYVKINWDNIPSTWHDQYAMANPPSFSIVGTYDYYSIMHYPMGAPETGLDAFTILDESIDPKLLGQSPTFTEEDLNNISALYC